METSTKGAQLQDGSAVVSTVRLSAACVCPIVESSWFVKMRVEKDAGPRTHI